jgi:hypothetical protein
MQTGEGVLMGLFARLFGRSGAKKVAEEALRRAGWESSRRRSIAELPSSLGTGRLVLHSAARAFLEEYYGLAVTVPIDGCSDITGFVHFAPEMVFRFLEPQRDVARLGVLIPGRCYPVGTTSGHTVFIFLNDAGRTYLVDKDWTLFGQLAAQPAEALERLCGGANGRVDAQVLRHGRPAVEVIREGAERKHWDLTAFPDLGPFMPPVSLSPLRRPPTWRPMVRSAQLTLKAKPLPRKRWSEMVVPLGEVERAPSGESFFVAHCENSLYVRRRAGFHVAPPPQGVPSNPRVGECFPCKPSKV